MSGARQFYLPSCLDSAKFARDVRRMRAGMRGNARGQMSPSKRAQRGRRLNYAVKAVTGIAQPRHDVRGIIEFLIKRSGNYRDVCAVTDGGFEGLHALGCGNQANAHNIFCSAFKQVLDRSNEGVACREHWINDEALASG